MKKTFVLDTNVLLHDPGSLKQFDDNDVCIPIYVIEEIDSFKKQINELGRNARTVARSIDRYREGGNLAEGVPMETGGVLRVAFTKRQIPREFAVTHAVDSMILAVALQQMEDNPHQPVVLVSMDTNLRIRADALGVTAEDYEAAKVDVSELYSGVSELTVEPGIVDQLHANGGAPLPADVELLPNQYVMLRNSARERETALARHDANDGVLRPLAPFRDGVFGIRPRNREQYFALDALLTPGIQLVTLAGKAGTGKTLLAAAAGLEQVMERDAYIKLLISRPIFPLGRDIGFLPGDVEQKLNPWMQPVYDNLELLMGLTQRERKNGRGAHELEMLGVVQVEPLTYIRGRSIPNQYMIVDEAQNLTPHEVKTILTRVGEGTKIVFTGDIYQIDNPYVDAVSNGLSFVAEKFKDQSIHAHVTLEKGERSELAELASNLL